MRKERGWERRRIERREDIQRWGGGKKWVEKWGANRGDGAK